MAPKIFEMVPLDYLSNFWRTLKMRLINYEINLIGIWRENCFVPVGTVVNHVPTFAITDT